LGTLQFASGGLYPYSPSDTGLPIGLLANRNHQALLLVIGILLLAQWGVRHGWAHRAAYIRLGIALVGILYFATAVLLTGSRTGLILAVIAVIGIIVTALIHILRGRQRRRARVLPLLLLTVSPLVMIGFAAYMAQDSGFMRLSRSAGQIGEDMRFLALPTMRAMAWHYFPWGTGFGSFDRVFMQFEPESLVKRGFFNRAHSDPLEILITGGLPALLVVGAFLLWFGRTAIAAFKEERHERMFLRRTATFALILCLLASIVDYPLRTPLLTVVAVILLALGRDATPPGRAVTGKMARTDRRKRDAAPGVGA
jgi:O-antigen ligase